MLETEYLGDPVLHMVVQRAAALFRDWLHMALFNEGIQLLQNNQDPECPSICCICLDAGATWGGIHARRDDRAESVHILACSSCIREAGGGEAWVRSLRRRKCPCCREKIVRMIEVFK